MANPQPMPFVQFSKELFDALLRAAMPATQQQVLMVVIRMTYGDRGRTEAPVSLGHLEKATGRSRSGVKDALRDLIKQGVVREVKQPRRNTRGGLDRRVLSVQKDYEKWGCYSVDPKSIPAFLSHDWQGEQGAQGKQGAQGEDSAPSRGSTAHGGGEAGRTKQGEQGAHIKDQTLKTTPNAREDARPGGGESAKKKGNGSTRWSPRATTCDGKPRANCRALTAHTDGAVRAELEKITGRGGAGAMYNTGEKLGRAVALVCERTCDLCQVEHAGVLRPDRDARCIVAVNRTFADVAAYHASCGVKNLPAFLEAKAKNAETLSDLVGTVVVAPSITRCLDCGVDLTFDEAGEHCSMCGRRAGQSGTAA